MKAFFYFSLFFILLIGVVLGYFYFSYEKPKQEELQIAYNNLSLAVFDFDSNKQIPTNFSIFYGNTFVYNSSTLKENYVFYQIPINMTFTVCFYSTGYYRTCSDFSDVYVNSNFRIDGKLKKVGEVKAQTYGILGYTKPLVLNLTSSGNIMDVKICLRWTDHILTSTIDNLPLTEKPLALQNKLDKCYFLNQSLNESYFLNVSYREYTFIQPSDSIKAYILYGDYYTSETIAEF